MMTLTGFYGLRPDSAVAHRLTTAAAATNSTVVNGTDPCGGRWMIALEPAASSAPGHDCGYDVTGDSGSRGFIAGTLFGVGPAGSHRSERVSGPTVPAAWMERADTLPRHVWGRYAAAVVTGDGELVLVRDPLGLAACYHMRCEQGIAFATRTESLLDMVGARPTFDWELIGSFLLQQHFPTSRTSLAGVSQLLPGGVLRASAGLASSPRFTTMWPQVALAREATVADGEEIRDTLRSCTRAWIDKASTVVVQLSGGLDSSSVLWAARQGLNARQRLLACSIYHSAMPASDERRYAAAMAACADAELTFVDAAQCSILGQPRQPMRRWDSVSMHPAELRMTEALFDGLGPDVATLAGGGGDQVFVTRGVGSPHLEDHVRARGVRAGVREVLAESRATGEPIAALTRASLRGMLSVHSRLLPRRPVGTLAVRFPTPPWLPSGFTPLPLTLPDGLTTLPFTKQQQLVGIAYWAGGVDRDHAATGALIYPMLSQPLVEIALRMPTHRLVDHADDRVPLRHAMREALPPVVAARRVKSEYSGLYQWAVRQNLAYLRDLVLDGAGVDAGLVDRKEVEVDLTRTAFGARPDPNWPLIGLIAAETWCRAWQAT
jgi:asparagine synthase (glutamine-hydrolysing)